MIKRHSFVLEGEGGIVHVGPMLCGERRVGVENDIITTEESSSKVASKERGEKF